MQHTTSLMPIGDFKDVAPLASPNLMSNHELECFFNYGFAGPFPCLSSAIERLEVPRAKHKAQDMLNLHHSNQDIYDICTHSSIVDKVNQIFGGNGVSLFKSRYWPKLAGGKKVAPWHQDIGDRNGGYEKSGCPVPTITVWLAIDRATPENGGLKIITKSHRTLVGNWRENIRANLTASDIANLDGDIQDLIVEPGDFYIMHSWLLHSSDRNTSAKDRVAINMRYCAANSNTEANGQYTPLYPVDTNVKAADRATTMKKLTQAWQQAVSPTGK